MRDIWSEDQELTPDTTFADAAQAYIEISKEIEKLEARKKRIVEYFQTQVPEDFGAHAVVRDGYSLTVEYGERWDWDSEILTELFASSDTLPDYVKKRLSVDKRTYGRLSEDKQRSLLPALTRKLGPAKITVIHE